MKQYAYFIFFLLLSSASFAQDTLVINRLDAQKLVRGLNLDSIQSSLKNRRNYARIIIDTVSEMELGSRGKSGLENLALLISKHKAIPKDTIYLYINEYQLNTKEIDSIWHSIYLRGQTQHLLKAYLKNKHNNIFLPKSYVNLISIFKSGQISYKTKQDLLVDKIRFDDETITKIKNDRPNYNINPYQPPRRVPSMQEDPNPYLISIPFRSQEQVASDYLKIIERNPGGNFSESKVLYVKAKYKKKQLRLIRSKLGKDKQTSKKAMRRFERLNIIDVQFNPPVSFYGRQDNNKGLLIIQYVKR